MSEIKRIIKYHRAEVKRLVGYEQAKVLFAAIKQGIPIIIYERNTDVLIDGDLYRSLKMLGAKKVYNFSLYLDRKKEIKGVFCAVFNIGYSQNFSKCLNAGEEE